jgi:hypothetical protein
MWETFAATSDPDADADSLEGSEQLSLRRLRDVGRQMSQVAELDGDRARRVRSVDAAACEEYEADDARDESRHIAIVVTPQVPSRLREK